MLAVTPLKVAHQVDAGESAFLFLGVVGVEANLLYACVVVSDKGVVVPDVDRLLATKVLGALEAASQFLLGSTGAVGVGGAAAVLAAVTLGLGEPF